MPQLPRILECVLVGASALAAPAPQEPQDAQGPPEAPPPRGLVEVVVVDGVDGSPIGGARLAVDFEPPDWLRQHDRDRLLIERETLGGTARWWLGTTDREGRAWVPAEDGRLALDRIVAPGYRSADGLRGRITEASQPTPIELLRPARLAGRVTGGVLATARSKGAARLRLRPLALRSGHVLGALDAGGRFALDGVPPWTELRAEILLPDGGVVPLEVGLRLDPDETRRVRYDLDTRPALEGLVVAADGEARVVATEVLAVPALAVGDRTPEFFDGDDPWIFDRATVARGGGFRFAALPPGEYWLAVWTDSRLFAVVGDPLRIEHGAGPATAPELGVVRARRVTGLLRDGGERPVAHALVEGRHLLGGQRRLATTQRDGTFTLGPFPLGPVEILRDGEELGRVHGADAGVLVEGRR